MRFYDSETDSYLCGKGSTVQDVLPTENFEHEKDIIGTV